jgi:hypothetical protein
MMGKALAFLGINLTQLGVIAALCASLFAGGYGLGRVQEAHGAVATIAKQAPAQLKTVTDQASGKIDGLNLAVASQQQTQDLADAAAHAQFIADKSRLEIQLADARAQLDQEKSHVCANDDTVLGGGDLRRVLDHAAGADGDVAGGQAPAKADRAGIHGSAAAGPEAADLTCGQLKAGYLNLAAWGRGLAAQLRALQTQARQLGLVAEEGKQP